MLKMKITAKELLSVLLAAIITSNITEGFVHFWRWIEIQRYGFVTENTYHTIFTFFLAGVVFYFLQKQLLVLIAANENN